MRGHLPHATNRGLSSSEDDPVVTQPVPGGGGGRLRKKGSGIRTWLMLSAAGKTRVVDAGRQVIMRRTGLPARDLRVLDPGLSYPSTVMGRERAIVINLEHIKAIITAKEVLLLNSRDPTVIPFVEELQTRILLHHHQVTEVQEGNSDDSNRKEVYDLKVPQSWTVSPRNTTMGFMQLQDQDGEDKAERKQELRNQDGMKILPFEFVALEACLQAACSALENEGKILEQEAHPALDKLTSEISILNLERVRQIKSRLVAITGRVQKVRDELEHLLDDDQDMAEMYLSDKLVQQQLENSSASSMNDEHAMDNQILQPDINDRMPPEISLEPGGGSSIDEDYQNADNSRDQISGASNGLGRDSHETQASTCYGAVTKKLDVEELEMLLGAYFVQIDGTLRKLSTLREYVDDTDDYINIMLDDKQNNLLRMGVMLATANIILNAFVLVTGIFSMNIHIELFDTGVKELLWVVGGCSAAGIFLYVVAIAWYKHKRLLE